MTRHEIEKRLAEMSEEMIKFYYENVPNGGMLSVIFTESSISIYNKAAYDDEYDDVIDLTCSKELGIYSVGHGGDFGTTLRTKEGKWLV